MCEIRRARRRAGAPVSPPTPEQPGATGILGFPDPGPPLFSSVTEVRERLAAVGYLADDGIAGVVHLADRLAKPVLVEGPAGTGKTELAKSVARRDGQPAHPVAVLRGARRVQGPLRVELQEAAPAHPGPAGRRRRGRRRGARPGRRQGRRGDELVAGPRGGHLLRGVPPHPPPARGHPLPGPGGPPRRRGGPRRARDRGAVARGAVGVPGVDPRARHHPGPADPARVPDLEQHP